MSQQSKASSLRQFIFFADQMRQIDRRFNLSPNESHLLDLVALANASRQNIFIKQLLSQKNIASSATLHKLIKQLVRKKLLNLVAHRPDGRHKKVVLAKLGHNRYEQLHKSMANALGV
ncbi:hypothetical protein A9236_02215 [Polynucleobacter sp. QLW-P1DATA-2]|uniref:hypothetical protein n=1 Tax=unclassified Polynucleobacter TaxID=2640945 RepID=UPI0008F8480A|nr:MULTISPECIES: hypothetical protein [unclassified Polynucleobacter]MBU3641366.1 hypothetical protein [Polynucleobacter sp. Fuers-14]OIN02965.1 hypothetical protein A9236_02215 [Polynucleobacter sp. QLW-P1DATA-2]OIN03076.1 hypothetical protein A9235_00305 [Polynucleobacter sp. MWH-Tro8-2-5-gr]